ncbi:MAG: helix-turn-helix domain-containing protein [Bacteroidales bacterium]|nr:helix-turn-helix domain-containing protein [Bacteroidales bacterium]
MDRKEALERRLAALCFMKTSLLNKTRRTEMVVVRRGFSDPDEASQYLADLDRIKSLTREIAATVRDIAKATDTPYGEEEVIFYDDALQKQISVDELADETGEIAKKVRSCTEIGERIRLLKEKTGLSLPALAALSGISKGTLQRYMSGKIKTVSVEYIERLARAFNVEPGVVAGWDVL